MALTEAEARSTIEQLVNSLREVELAWVVEQVREELTLGVPETREAETLTELPPEQQSTGNKFKGKRQTHTTTRPYSPHEELFLYVRAMEYAIIGISDIERTLLANFAAAVPGLQGVVFVDEIHEEPTTRMSSTAGLQVREESILRLRDLITELRREL